MAENETKSACLKQWWKINISPCSLDPCTNYDSMWRGRIISYIVRPCILADSRFYKVPAVSVNHCRSGDSCPFVKVSPANL